MLSEFGKFSRKLRIDNDELLLDMARKLGVSTSFLSSVEIGRKSVPSEWEQNLSKLYDLTNDQIVELKKAITNSTKSLKFDLTERDDTSREILMAFARKLDTMEDAEKGSILEILSKV